MTIPVLAGVTARDVTTDRLTTRVLFSGPDDGIPVLLIHGNFSNATWWEETIVALPPKFRSSSFLGEISAALTGVSAPACAVASPYRNSPWMFRKNPGQSPAFCPSMAKKMSVLPPNSMSSGPEPARSP